MEETQLHNFPKVILFLLQNINRISLKDLKSTKLPWLPLQLVQDTKLNFILFEIFALVLAGKMHFSVDLNLQPLANAPTLADGLI